jgi:hypothetical protein
LRSVAVGAKYYPQVFYSFHEETPLSAPVCHLENSFLAVALLLTYTAVQVWRLTNFNTINNAGKAADSADPDGDGMTNAQEFAAGTDPDSRASALKISSVAKSGNDMLVSFPTIAGKTFRLDCSSTLQSGSWTTVQDGIAGTGDTVQITDIGGALQPRRFYHIVVQ